MKKYLIVAAALLLASPLPALAQDNTGASTPTGAIDGFHRAITIGDTAGALSLLARDLVVYEFGVIDPTAEAYAFQHLPLDEDMASASSWDIVDREVGGVGDYAWVLTKYHVYGVDKAGNPFDQQVMETAILTRTGGKFRISHFHWSTDNVAYQAQANAARILATQNGAGRTLTITPQLAPNPSAAQ